MQPLYLDRNENPLGPSPRAVAAMTRAASGMHLYGEAGCDSLRRALAGYHGLSMEHVLTGHGSGQLIELALRAVASSGHTVVLPEVTFNWYRQVLERHAVPCRLVPWTGQDPPLDTLLSHVDDRTAMVVVCNPNNPTGGYYAGEAIRTFLSRLPAGCVLLLDEAYAEYAGGPGACALNAEIRADFSLLVMRTFAKVHGLAGARVGYALGPERLLDRLRLLQVPFSPGSPSQAAAEAALGDTGHVLATVADAAESGRILAGGLADAGIAFLASAAPFLLVRVGDGDSFAATLWSEHRIRVAPGSQVGAAPEWVRISLPAAAQAPAVVAAVRSAAAVSRHAGANR